MIESRMISFLTGVYGELLKVTWPTRPEVIRLTMIVIGISVIVGAFLGGVDFIFTKMLEYLIQ